MYKYLLIIGLSALPIIEARFGFAIGYKIFEISPFIAIPLAYIGNLISAFFVTYILYFLLDRSKENFFKRFMNKVVEIVKSKHQKKIESYALLSLILFIGIPFPLSGTYTGIVIGYLIGLPKHKTLAAAAIGTAISLTVVLLTIESVDISSKFFVKFFQ